MRARASRRLAGAVFGALSLGGVPLLPPAAGGAAHAAVVTVEASDPAGKPLPGTVLAVMVKGVPAAAPADATAQITQKGKQFHPELTVIQTFTAVSFPNQDLVRHHVYSFSPVHRFELKLYAGTPAAPVVFDKPGVAVLGCNIHDRMHAWVVVVDTPYFASTDDAGRATLNVPAGDHLLRAWSTGMAEDAPWTEQRLRVGDTPSSVRIVVEGGAPK